jgi:hypothetical protein
MIARKVHYAGTGAEKDAVGIVGIKGETADSSAVRAQRLPLLPRESRAKHENHKQNVVDANPHPKAHERSDQTFPKV